MKITDVKNASRPVTKMNADVVDRKGKSSTPFKDVLAKADAEDLNQQLYQLLEDIDKAGERLAEKSNIRDLLEYKRLVSRFLSTVLNNAFKKSTTANFDRRGRQKIYSIIKRVNNHLEELTRKLVEKEQDTLNLLERIGEIRGLLLDLFI
ncbi:MAG TPA: YaaR family protein [Clostridiales bacterium]|jgi:uncharacterized protein YaaR (DUF327 family)|nr:YaaR family protein [Clostridiales bacterium]